MYSSQAFDCFPSDRVTPLFSILLLLICYITHLQPPNVEEELEQSEERDVEIHAVLWIVLLRIQVLSSHYQSQGVRVDGQRHHLL